MDEKGINATGLAHIWKAITQVFATKEYVDDELAKVDSSGGSDGSTGDNESVYFDIIDDGTLCARHNGLITYKEVLTAVNQKAENVFFRVFYEDPAENDPNDFDENNIDDYLVYTSPMMLLRYAGYDPYLHSLYFSGMAYLVGGYARIGGLHIIRGEDFDGSADNLTIQDIRLT